MNVNTKSCAFYNFGVLEPLPAALGTRHGSPTGGPRDGHKMPSICSYPCTGAQLCTQRINEPIRAKYEHDQNGHGCPVPDTTKHPPTLAGARFNVSRETRYRVIFIISNRTITGNNNSATMNMFTFSFT